METPDDNYNDNNNNNNYLSDDKRTVITQNVLYGAKSFSPFKPTAGPSAPNAYFGNGGVPRSIWCGARQDVSNVTPETGTTTFPKYVLVWTRR